MDRAVFVWVISVVEGSGALGVRMYVYVHLRVPSTGSYSGGLDSCGNVPRQSCRVVLSHMFDVGSTVFGSLLMHFTEVVQCLTIGHVQQAIDVVSLKIWRCGGRISRLLGPFCFAGRRKKVALSFVRFATLA